MAGNFWGGAQGYPANYQANTQQAQNGGVMTVFVSNDSSAAAYPVAAGSTVSLVDLDHGNMWLKSMDMNGVPCPIRTFKIEETTPQGQGNTVTRQEFEALQGQLQQILAAIQPKAGGKKE